MRISRIGLTVLLACALGGCGGGGAEGPPGAATPAMTVAAIDSRDTLLDACTLVTAADLAEVLPDVSFSAPETSTLRGASGMGSKTTCTYNRVDETTDESSIADLRAALERATTVTVIAWTWPEASGAEGYVRSFVNAGAPVERIEDLGDEALALGAPMFGVHWRADRFSASIAVTGRWLDADGRRAAELALARKAAARIQR